LITTTHNSSDPQQRYGPTQVIGAYVLDGGRGTVSPFFAASVILTTGGVGNLFLHTSNPMRATGDGVAMAYRIGAGILNAEYVQFHPTVLYHRDCKRFLISEAMRGEGARLLNLRGVAFMQKYEPADGELAPRDRVTRAIYREMDAENCEHVLLDASSIGSDHVERRFPLIFRTCMELGIDCRREPIPVVPAAHYFCGGVGVDLVGRTSIPGLWAAGECACTGVHGANRLASISLLEGLVWGVRSGGGVPSDALPSKTLRDSIPDWVYPPNEEVFDPLLVKQDFRTIQSTMWYYAGVIRTRKRLQRALADLDYLSHRVEQFYREAKLTRGIVELRNSVLTAGLIVRAATANPVPKGCHWIE
jgi:L-aspartate oxidase